MFPGLTSFLFHRPDNVIALITKENQEMQTNELKERIAAPPASLQEALERQAKAYIAIVRLEAQIAKLEAEIQRQEDTDDDHDNDESDSLEDNLDVARLDAKVERLKLKVSETEDRAEMNFRALGKATDAQVKAAVGSNPDVIAAKEKLQDAKEALVERKIVLRSQRQAVREAQMNARQEADEDVDVEDERLSKLREKLVDAREEGVFADVQVEVIRATAEAYKMLTQLSND
jgi:hypothetical protein